MKPTKAEIKLMHMTKLVINGKPFMVQMDAQQILRNDGAPPPIQVNRLDIGMTTREMVKLRELLTKQIDENKTHIKECNGEVAVSDIATIYGHKMKCVLGESCGPCEVKNIGEDMCKHIKCKRTERSDKCGVHFEFEF